MTHEAIKTQYIVFIVFENGYEPLQTNSARVHNITGSGGGSHFDWIRGKFPNSFVRRREVGSWLVDLLLLPVGKDCH